MSKIRDKYNSIDLSKLKKDKREKLEKIKTLTNNFENAELNKKVEPVLDEFIAKVKKENPDAIKSVKSKSTHTAKRTAPAPATTKKVVSELEKLKAEIKSDPILKNVKFGKSDLLRDAKRRARTVGKRTSQKGWKNQYGASKGGRTYYETRENRSDRTAPNYPNPKVKLAKGGELYTPTIYFFMADNKAVRDDFYNMLTHWMPDHDYIQKLGDLSIQIEGNTNDRAEFQERADNWDGIQLVPDEKFAKGGTVPYNYVHQAEIVELKTKLNNKLSTIQGKDVLSGVYVKVNKSKTPQSIKKKIMDYANEVYPDGAKEFEPFVKDADLNEFKKHLPEKMILAFYCGINASYTMQIDNEADWGLLSFRTDGDYIEREIKRAIENCKNNRFELGIKYPTDIDFEKYLGKPKKTENIIGKKNPLGYQYNHKIWQWKNLVGGKAYEYINKEGEVIPLDKSDSLTGGYLGFVSSNANILDRLMNFIAKQKGGYVKDVNIVYNGLGGVDGKELDEHNIEYAKGGEIIWVDPNERNRGSVVVWTTMKNREKTDSVGAFAHRLNGKYKGDYFLYPLSDFDKDFYSHIKLKDGEKLMRIETENMVGGEMPLVKVNLKNGRIYFMSDDTDEKNPQFENASVDVIYLSLDKKLKPKEMAKGGKTNRAKDYKYLNESEDYEVRYAKEHDKNRPRYMEIGGVVADSLLRLKSGEKIKIKFDSSSAKDQSATLEVVSNRLVRKNTPKEQRKITFVNEKNPNGVKYYAYIKQGKPTFAKGDLSIYNVNVFNPRVPRPFAKGGRTKSALMKDRKYFNPKQKWEVDYAKKSDRKRTRYNPATQDRIKATKMKDGGYVDFSVWYKDGGVTDKNIHIVNEGVKFDKEKYRAIFGDFDKDGISNVDDRFPLDKSKTETVEQVSLSDSVDSLLQVKNELDDTMAGAVEVLKSKAPADAQIYARTKTPYSIIRKLIYKKLIGKEGLTDLVGTTLVVENHPELMRIKTQLDNGLMGEIMEFKDYYKNPKDGYMAYHYIIDYNGIPVELQLKTKKQKYINEISHEFYKDGTLTAEGNLALTQLVDKADKGDKFAQQKVKELFRDKQKIADILQGKKKLKSGGWIQEAQEEMEANDTVGDFTAKAKARGLDPVDFAKQVLSTPKKFNLKTRKQAQFVKNANPEKFENGGRVNETLTNFKVFYKGKEHIIPAHSLSDGKLKAIRTLNIPAKDQNRFAIISEDAYDSEDFQFMSSGGQTSVAGEMVEQGQLDNLVSTEDMNSMFEKGGNLANFKSILKSRYSHGSPLKELYDETIDALGEENGALVFQSFIKENSNNEKLLKEFQSTSFEDGGQTSVAGEMVEQGQLDNLVSTEDMNSMFSKGGAVAGVEKNKLPSFQEIKTIPSTYISKKPNYQKDYEPLPDDLKKYFHWNPDEKVELISVEDLRPTHKAGKNSFGNAYNLMKKAYKGEGGKRKPIIVFYTQWRGDKTAYKVYDGNTTYSVARMSNWDKLPCVVVPHYDN